VVIVEGVRVDLLQATCAAGNLCGVRGQLWMPMFDGAACVELGASTLFARWQLPEGGRGLVSVGHDVAEGNCVLRLFDSRWIARSVTCNLSRQVAV
jgi:hypothetical protein